MKLFKLATTPVMLVMMVLGAKANAETSTAEMVRACTGLNHDYAIARDTADADAFAGLFTEDAVFTMQGQTFAGREKILERLKPGASANFARLLINTVQIKPTSGDTASGVTYFTMFMAAEGNEPDLPVTDFIVFMGEYHDKYLMTGEGCKITDRKTVPMFSGALRP
ncbi:nuclear transport factor 2 family protein [Hyphococcus sp.]|uniref:nuclear transport factor 2 family protein n=1 Tax=Hyphococcus sp. TaxID=2038636 RepID=UPI003CCB765D